MLAGAAQRYFSTLKQRVLDIASYVSITKEMFQTGERTRTLLREWGDLSLSNVSRFTPSEPMSQSFLQLIVQLSDIQCCLPDQYQNFVILRDELLNSIRDTSCCLVAYQNPASTLRGVIVDL